MQNQAKHIILAEDDEDDSQFFEEAIRSLAPKPTFMRARDGVELTNILQKLTELPDLIFLDLNMPRKNGAQCLTEIRKQKKLKNLPVVVLSTSCSPDIINSMYESGANLYVQKPSDIRIWKNVIAKVLGLDWNIQTPFSIRENFTLLSI